MHGPGELRFQTKRYKMALESSSKQSESVSVYSCIMMNIIKVACIVNSWKERRCDDI